MITIKFANYYKKMPYNVDVGITKLVGVQNVDLENLSPAFLRMDTAIRGGGYYRLPKKGKYMILRLDTEIENYFTHEWQTIRRWTSEKEAYYRSHIGEEVKIKIKEEK